MGFPSLVFLPKKTIRFVLCAGLAIALHAWFLFGWKLSPKMIHVFEGEEGRVEVSLVESPLESTETLQPPPPTSELESPGTEPEPIPVVASDKLPEFEKPAPEATPQYKVEPTPVSRPPSKPRSVAARLSKPVLSQKTAPMSSGVSQSDSSTTGKAVSKKIGKPAFITKPSASYPSESRKAGEQGSVMLRITVDSRGRPSDVSVLVSSGFPRLDRAAVEGGWRCRIRNAESGAQFDAPLRFDLRF
jgi:protein TonB